MKFNNKASGQQNKSPPWLQNNKSPPWQQHNKAYKAYNKAAWQKQHTYNNTSKQSQLIELWNIDNDNINVGNNKARPKQDRY
jgi:hypothetical protein